MWEEKKQVLFCGCKNQLTKSRKCIIFSLKMQEINLPGRSNEKI